MHIFVVGLNHKTASVDLREAVAFSETNIESPLRLLTSLSAVSEALILSTCNRVEIYAASLDPGLGCNQVEHFLGSYHGLSQEDLKGALYSYQDTEAIQHLFQVASSLDSMLLGESQILGQLKKAYGQAVSSETTGKALTRLLPKAFSVAKRIRTETAVGRCDVSVPAAAVKLIKETLGDLKDKTVLLIGAGKMSEVAGEQLAQQGAASIYVTNRTFERSQQLASQFQSEAVPFEDLPLCLRKVDVVLSSTSAPHTILSHQDVTQARKGQDDELLLVDIAVPRDIDPLCGEIEGVQLYDVDALREQAPDVLLSKEEETGRALQTVEEEVRKYQAELAARGASPIIAALHERLEKIRAEELQKSRPKLVGLSEEQMEAVESLTISIVKKVLHEPAMAIKKLSAEKNRAPGLEDLSLILGAME